MRRRGFIALVGGAAAWPLVARAQRDERVRRIGVLINFPENDLVSEARLAAFRKALQELGWTDGQNLRIEVRWGSDTNRVLKSAAELVANPQDILLAVGPPSVLAVRQLSQTVPIVFLAVTDPVGLGLVQSLARPGSNATGFTPAAEFSTSAKWLELLREIAPAVRQVSVLREPSNPSAMAQFAAVQTAANTLGMELIPLGLRDANEIERGLSAFARSPNSGLIITRTSEAIAHRDLIITLAARYRLPAVFPLRDFVTSGGLISYGPDVVVQFRQAAAYVDRILKGERPADLPVGPPDKYNLTVNVNAAKGIGIAVPESVLARADEVIE